MQKKNNLHIFDTPEQLTEATAGFIVSSAKDAIAQRGRFIISLSGGHTPERLYALLSKPPYVSQVDWHKTFIFWGDERCVPATDKQNNALMAKTLLLDHIDIPQANIYPMPVDIAPTESANEYEQTIKDFFNAPPPQFDLILLGLGENGHTASLFPGTDVINEHTRLVKEVYVAEQSMYRITMTLPLINKARNIMFLVEGSGKAEIVNTILHAPYEPAQYPAQLIEPENGSLYWFIDKKAAAQLPAQD